MIRLVVAEDQQLILKDLCKKIEKADGEVQIVAVAQNGEDALAKVLQHRPDIFITDIRMPVLTGLEVIAELKSREINTHTVLISGYRDFEYAREAIKLGVDEYLLKPLSVDDIRYVLQALKEKITMSEVDYQQHIVEEILRSNTYTMPQIQTSFLFERYYVMLMMAGSYPTFSINYAIPNQPVHEEYDLNRMFSPLLGPGEKLYVCPGKNYNESICVFCLNQSGRELPEKAAGLLIGEKTGGPKMSAPVTICISRSIKHIDNAGIESQIMRGYLSGHLIFGKNSILYCDVVSVNEQSGKDFFNKEMGRRFAQYMAEGDTQRFLNGLKQLLDRMEAENAAQKEVDVTLKRLFRISCTGEAGSAKNSYDMDLDEFITNSKSYAELHSYLEFLVLQLSKGNAKTAAADPEEMVRKIRNYMEAHYMEDLNINEIAGIFSLTPAYFSRLFKKHTMKRPLEYLTGVRMAHACDYFCTTDLPVKDVAELCGYSDPFHFSKNFKSSVGQSPSEYRIQNRGKVHH